MNTDKRPWYKSHILLPVWLMGKLTDEAFCHIGLAASRRCFEGQVLLPSLISPETFKPRKKFRHGFFLKQYLFHIYLFNDL